MCVPISGTVLCLHVLGFCCYCLFVKLGSPCLVLVVLELICIPAGLAHRSACFCLLTTEIKGMCHHILLNFLRKYGNKHLKYLYVCAHAYTMAMFGGQTTIYKNWFFSSTIWILEIELRLSGLVASLKILF